MNGVTALRPITGFGVALATPFTTGTENAVKPEPSGTAPRPPLDLGAYRALVRRTREGGADFLVVLGSTGEAATVTDSERSALIAATVEEAGSLPVVAGVGHHDTYRCAELAQAAVADGADALLIVTPYYNRPQDEGLYAHYAQVAAAAPGVPIIVYNVPSRTGANLTPEALQRLWTIPQVVAIKESSGDLRQISTMCRQAPHGKVVLAGDDDLALPAIAVGAQGLISVCGNVAPEHTAALVHAAMSGASEQATALHHSLAPLVEALFAETNPVPVKAALAVLGIGSGMVRAPLAPADPHTWARVQAALSALGLLGPAPASAAAPTRAAEVAS